MTTQDTAGQGPANTPAPSGNTEQAGRRRGPSTLGYWLAAAIVVAGFVGAGVIAVATGIGAWDRLSDMPRAAVPGELAVTVDETGDQVVYYFGGTVASWRDLGLEVTGPDGAAVLVSSYCPGVRTASFAVNDEELRWDARDRDEHNVLIATFDADAPGEYVVATTGAVEDDGELAVGDDLVRPVVVLMIVAGGVSLAGLAGGVTLFVVTGARRSRARAAA